MEETKKVTDLVAKFTLDFLETFWTGGSGGASDESTHGGRPLRRTRDSIPTAVSVCVEVSTNEMEKSDDGLPYVDGLDHGHPMLEADFGVGL